MKIVPVFTALFAIVCVLQKAEAEDPPTQAYNYDAIVQELLNRFNGDYQAVIDYLVSILKQLGFSVPSTQPAYPRYPAGTQLGTGQTGWNLENSDFLSDGSASAGQNVLTSGSTSMDAASVTNTKSQSRTRENANVGFGMIGGDGGDNFRTVNGGISKSGGGIDNMFSKISGINNQGVNGQNTFWKLLAEAGYLPNPNQR